MSEEQPDTDTDEAKDAEVERRVAFEAGEEMEVLGFDVPWDGDLAKDLSDALFEVVADHHPEAFTEGVRENPRGVKCKHISLTVSVHENGQVEVIVPERYTP